MWRDGRNFFKSRTATERAYDGHQANMTEPTFVQDANYYAAGKETIDAFKPVKIPESQPSSNAPARDVLPPGDTLHAKRLAIKEGLAKKMALVKQAQEAEKEKLRNKMALVKQAHDAATRALQNMDKRQSTEMNVSKPKSKGLNLSAIKLKNVMAGQIKVSQSNNGTFVILDPYSFYEYSSHLYLLLSTYKS
jgi:hypothetical protein